MIKLIESLLSLKELERCQEVLSLGFSKENIKAFIELSKDNQQKTIDKLRSLEEKYKPIL